MRQKSKTKTIPFTIVIDSNEQYPYTFDNIPGDSKDQYKPLVIATKKQKLKTGDYSILGKESRLSIERKSKEDIFQTLASRRDEFENEVFRLNQMECAHILIEAELSSILNNPPAESHLTPKIIHRTAISWSYKYSRVHWWFVPGRRFAEIFAFRIMRDFWEKENEGSR